MFQPANILVFGATGLIGTFITQQLLAAKSNFKRIAIFTSPNTVETKKEIVEKLKAQGVEVIVGDVTKEKDVRAAYEGFDTIVSAVGRAVIASQIELLRWADSTPHVQYFFPSEYGTDIEYFPESISEPPHQQKLKVRKFIKENVKRLQVTYLVTGPYSDLWLGKGVPGHEGAGRFDVKARQSTLAEDGSGKVSLTTMKDVGVLLVGALLHRSPEQSGNVRTLKVNSFTTTPTEVVKEFEKQTGSKWEVEYTKLEDMRKIEREKWEKEDPMATVWTLRRIWAEGGTSYEKRDNASIGEPKMGTLEEQVGASIEKQMPGKL